jgi:hypothetical protein
VLSLMDIGIMCRGYITRGSIFHTAEELIGSGYQKAYGMEDQVTVFRKNADERGTPFVELDRSVCSYVDACQDGCVKELFGRFTATDGTLSALYPFKRLAHQFLVSYRGEWFDPQKERQANANVRKRIEGLKARVGALVDLQNPSAVSKANHYLWALDAQLELCKRIDEFIDRFGSG